MCELFVALHESKFMESNWNSFKKKKRKEKGNSFFPFSGTRKGRLLMYSWFGVGTSMDHHSRNSKELNNIIYMWSLNDPLRRVTLTFKPFTITCALPFTNIIVFNFDNKINFETNYFSTFNKEEKRYIKST